MCIRDSRSYPSVRDGAGAHDACLEALPAGLGAHRLWRADEQRSGGAGWEDSVAGGWLRLTRLLVVVPVVGDLYGHVHGGTAVSYTHLRAHETVLDLVCRLLL